MKICVGCDHKNPDGSNFCSNCGTALAESGPAPAQENDTQKSKRDQYYAEAVGPRSADYYLRLFQRFGAQRVGVSWNWGAAMSWNWAAFFLGLPWLAYRKMWFWALLYFAPLLAVAGIAQFYPGLVIKFVPAYLIYLLLIFVLFPIYANALYYRRLRRKIHEVTQHLADMDQRLAGIASGCGTNLPAALIVFFAILIPASIVVENSISSGIESLRETIVKGKVNDRLILAERYKANMEVYFGLYGEWPDSTAQLYTSVPDPVARTEQIKTKGNGRLIVNFADIYENNGGSISFQPFIKGDGGIVWTCSAQDMKEEHFPVRCEQ